MQVKVMLLNTKVNQVSFENCKQGKPSSTFSSIKNRYPTFIWAAKYLNKSSSATNVRKIRNRIYNTNIVRNNVVQYKPTKILKDCQCLLLSYP